MTNSVGRAMKMMWFVLVAMVVLGAVSAREQNMMEDEMATRRVLSREY